MKDRARKCLKNIKPYVPGKPIDEVKRELGLEEVIKLASNENSLGSSPLAIQAARKALRDVNRYPDSSSYYLTRALARRFGLKPENFVIGNGSDEIIVLAVRAFVERGDEVVIARPTFLIYEIAAYAQEARVRSVPLKNFRYDLRAMRSAIGPKTKMVFIANPDNPTGTYVTKRELDEFISGVSRRVVIFLDEAYYEFAEAQADYPNGVAYLNRPNVIVARTFSKAYGLSGLRIGYAIADSVVAELLSRVKEPFNVNIVAQAAALAALDDKKFLKKTTEHVRVEKKYLYRSFEEMGLAFIPSATNFILVDTGRVASSVYKALLKKGVIVRDMSAWGFRTYIRVTIGTRKENIRFVGALEEALRQ